MIKKRSCRLPGIIDAEIDSAALHAGKNLEAEVFKFLMEHGDQLFVQGADIVQIIRTLVDEVQLEAEDTEQSGFKVYAIFTDDLLQRDSRVLDFPYNTF